MVPPSQKNIMEFDDGRYTTPSEFEMKEIAISETGLSVSLEPRVQSRTRGLNDAPEQRMKGKPAKLTIGFREFGEMAAALADELRVLHRVVPHSADNFARGVRSSLPQV